MFLTFCLRGSHQWEVGTGSPAGVYIREAYSSGRAPREGLQFQSASQSGPEVWSGRECHADIVSNTKGQCSQNDSLWPPPPPRIGWPTHIYIELTDLPLTKELGLFHFSPVLSTPHSHPHSFGIFSAGRGGSDPWKYKPGDSNPGCAVWGGRPGDTLDPALRESAVYMPDFSNYHQHFQVLFENFDFLELCWALIVWPYETKSPRAGWTAWMRWFLSGIYKERWDKGLGN